MTTPTAVRQNYAALALELACSSTYVLPPLADCVRTLLSHFGLTVIDGTEIASMAFSSSKEVREFCCSCKNAERVECLRGGSYILTTGFRNKILNLAPDGRQVLWTMQDSGLTKCPLGIAERSWDILVADPGTESIVSFNREGKELSVFSPLSSSSLAPHSVIAMPSDFVVSLCTTGVLESRHLVLLSRIGTIICTRDLDPSARKQAYHGSLDIALLPTLEVVTSSVVSFDLYRPTAFGGGEIVHTRSLKLPTRWKWPGSSTTGCILIPTGEILVASENLIFVVSLSGPSEEVEIRRLLKMKRSIEGMCVPWK